MTIFFYFKLILIYFVNHNAISLVVYPVLFSVMVPDEYSIVY